MQYFVVCGFRNGNDIEETYLGLRGATLAQMQTVGRWKTSRMSASYCRNELAGRSAVATLLYKDEGAVAED